MIAGERNCRLRRVDKNTGIIQAVAVNQPIEAGWDTPLSLTDPERNIVFLEATSNVVSLCTLSSPYDTSNMSDEASWHSEAPL
jgi:hypothetical protein